MQKPDPKLSIESPCPKKWGELVGDETKRFCSQCQKHVYNGASLTQLEATDLVREGQGSTCMRLVSDESGSIQYKDSPKRTKPSSIVRRAGLAIAAGGLVAACSAQSEQATTPEVKPIAGSEQAGMPIPGTDLEEPIEIFEEELGEICEDIVGDVMIEGAQLDEPHTSKEGDAIEMLGYVKTGQVLLHADEDAESRTESKTDDNPSAPPEILGTPSPVPPPTPPNTDD